MRERDCEFLRRVVAGGAEGINMGMGDTSATKRLTAEGLVRWEQAHPFVARVYATHKGCAVLGTKDDLLIDPETGWAFLAADTEADERGDDG
jgi:hypothetical protein